MYLSKLAALFLLSLTLFCSQAKAQGLASAKALPAVFIPIALENPEHGAAGELDADFLGPARPSDAAADEEQLDSSVERSERDSPAVKQERERQAAWKALSEDDRRDLELRANLGRPRFPAIDASGMAAWERDVASIQSWQLGIGSEIFVPGQPDYRTTGRLSLIGVADTGRVRNAEVNHYGATFEYRHHWGVRSQSRSQADQLPERGELFWESPEQPSTFPMGRTYEYGLQVFARLGYGLGGTFPQRIDSDAEAFRWGVGFEAGVDEFFVFDLFSWAFDQAAGLLYGVATGEELDPDSDWSAFGVALGVAYFGEEHRHGGTLHDFQVDMTFGYPALPGGIVVRYRRLAFEGAILNTWGVGMRLVF